MCVCVCWQEEHNAHTMHTKEGNYISMLEGTPHQWVIHGRTHLFGCEYCEVNQTLARLIGSSTKVLLFRSCTIALGVHTLLQKVHSVHHLWRQTLCCGTVQWLDLANIPVTVCCVWGLFVHYHNRHAISWCSVNCACVHSTFLGQVRPGHANSATSPLAYTLGHSSPLGQK